MPILLASMLARYDASSDVDPWPMVRAAAAYVVRSGRRPPQIAGRRKAATHRIRWRRKSPRSSPRQNSPIDWFQSIDRLMYVRDTALAQRHGVSGYYVRLTPPGAVRDGGVPIPRSPLRLADQECVNASLPYEDAVSADALARTRRQSRSVAVLPALSGGALTAIRDLRRACLAIALVTQGFVFLVVLDAAAVFLCHIPSSAYRVSGHLQVWQPSFRCVPSSCGAHSAPAERRYGHGPSRRRRRRTASPSAATISTPTSTAEKPHKRKRPAQPGRVVEDHVVRLWRLVLRRVRLHTS
jgi:hypothetical protein